MKHLLITGFEPFDLLPRQPGAQVREKTNSSQEVLRQIVAPAGWRLTTAVLPVSFANSFEILTQALADKPRVIICLGQSAGRSQISLERIAINLIDASIPDNLGAKPQDVPISTGPAALWSTLPLKLLQKVCHQAQIPVELSNSAGLYVCNYIFYRLMEACQDRDCLAGFIHLPPAETLALEHARSAMQLIVNTLCSAEAAHH